MAKKWREFEKLAARIEELLSPKGAVVKSPDRITDKVTGQEREVDASIRYSVGSVNVLITIECRDRRATPDDTWIEQLATKKRKIGASHTIAVSRTSFTKPAIKSARQLGIELRVIKTIRDEDILSWLSRIRITNEIGKGCFEGIKVKVYDEDEDVRLDPEVLEEIEREQLQAAIFYIERNHEKTSIASLLDYFAEVYATSRVGATPTALHKKAVLRPGDHINVELHPGFISLFDDVPVNAGDLGRSKTFIFKLLYGAALIQTIKGPKYVKQVELELVLAKEIQQIPISRAIQYAAADEPVRDIVEVDIELFHYDRRKEVILSYSVPSDEHGPVIVMATDNQVEASQEGIA